MQRHHNTFTYVFVHTYISRSTKYYNAYLILKKYMYNCKCITKIALCAMESPLTVIIHCIYTHIIFALLLTVGILHSHIAGLVSSSICFIFLLSVSPAPSSLGNTAFTFSRVTILRLSNTSSSSWVSASRVLFFSRQ